MATVQLEQDQWPLLKDAVDERWPETQKKLAARVGLSESQLSRILSGRQPSIPMDALDALVSILELKPEQFFRQLELPLSAGRLADLEQIVAREIRRLGKEVGSLHGSTFHAFVGFRVEGAVRKTYERRIPLHLSYGNGASGSVSRPDAAA